MSNRRFYSRANVSVRAEVGYEGMVQQGQVRDVSLGGLFLTEVEGIPEGAQCQVTIVLEGVEPPIRIPLVGNIVRASEDGVGFHIEHLDPNQVSHLRNLVLYNAEDPEEIMTEWSRPECLKKVLQEILLAHLTPSPG